MYLFTISYGSYAVDQRSGARKPTLLGWRYPPSILLVIRHTWFWMWAAHDRLDRDQQSEDFRNMHGIVALLRNSDVPAILRVRKLKNQKHAPTATPCFFTVDVLETSDAPI